jgi:DNA polymerase-3 subunit gamma/tau
MQSGHDLREFVGGLAEHFRNVLVAKTTGSTHLIETSEVCKKRYEALAQECNEHDLLRLIKITQDLEQSIRWVSQPRYKLELALIQMIKMENSVRIEELLDQINVLKKKLSGGSPTLSLSPASQDSRSAASNPPASRPASEMRVVGTVNAGTLRSASYVSPSRKYQPLDLARAAASPSAYAVQDSGFEKASLRAIEFTPVPVVSITTQELEARWQEFIDGVTKAKIAIGTVLTESHFAGCVQGSIRIGCPDEYHLSMLKRNKEFLSETLNSVLGIRMSVEPVLNTLAPGAPQQSQPVPHNGSKPTNDNGKRDNGSSEEHPVLALLRKELGAEPVQ